MTLSVAWLCFLLLCLVALNDAWLLRRSRRRNSARCDSKRNCVSCTNHKSWSGKPCRWCPRDKKCHAYGAIFTNPCSTTEDVVSAKACSSIVNPIYDSSLAFKMVYLSALAYADVAKYIPKATEVGCRSFTIDNKNTFSTVHFFSKRSNRWRSTTQQLTLMGRRELQTTTQNEKNYHTIFPLFRLTVIWCTALHSDTKLTT